jgi:UDP:flavonoid glycosyltransferase YjiC (YdhE family)
MRILFSTQPLHGHVNTVLPQALAARDAGHEVLVTTGASVTELIGGFALELAVTGPESAPRGPGTDFMAFFMDSARGRIDAMVDLIGSWQADLVIHEETELSGAVAGSLTSTRSVVHGLGLLPGFAIWEIWSAAMVGMARERGADLDVARLRDHTTYLQVCPEALIDAGERFWHVVQPLRHTAGSARPGETLPARIARLPYDRLVHLTLGTLFNEQPTVLGAALAGLRDLPVNVVVTTGPGTDPASLGPQPDHVLVTPYVSHALLLPRCDLVVSHGGAGAMFGTLANGLPQLVLPQGVDQDWNAVALAHSGAGLAIGREDMTTVAVRDAAAQLLAEPRFGQRATEIGREMAAMPDPSTVIAKLTG